MDKNKLGRHRLSETEETVTATITLTASQKEWLRQYGFGRISLGVQRLVDEKRDSALPIEKETD